MSRDTHLLAEQVREALVDCDDMTRTRGVSMAASLSGQLPPGIPEDVVAAAVAKALVRDGLPAIGNPFLYAKETALRMAGDDFEAGLERAERAERRPAPGYERTEGWRAAQATTQAGTQRASMDPEADQFMVDLEAALARQPRVMIGAGPSRATAKDRLLDAVSLLYRSRGQAAGQFFTHEGRTIALCLRRADAEWVRQRAFDWFGFVRASADAARSGAAYVPEIPNPYRFVLESLMAYRKVYGGEEVDAAVAAPFVV